jgi:hypothetical protein
MKILFCGWLILLCLARLGATPLTIDGELNWDITEPRCVFKLDGTISNYTPDISGTLKLVLWATPRPFPSQGYVIAEYRLGQLPSGSQFKDFKVKTTSDIPNISGDFYMTIAIIEFTSAGWKNVAKSDTGIRRLQVGNFPSQAKWTFPTLPITEPSSNIVSGNTLRLTALATEDSNAFPLDSQDKTKLTVLKGSKVSVSSRAGKKPVTYTYRKKLTKLGNKSVKVGSLVINYGGKDPLVTQTSLTLYFHSANSGTYKSLELGSAKETIWGSFTVK